MKKFVLLASLLLAGPAIAKQEYIIKVNDTVSIEQLEAEYGAQNVQDLNFNNWVKVTVGSEKARASLSRVASVVEKNKKFRMALHQREDSPFPFPFPGGGDDGGDDGGGGLPFPFPFPGEDGGDDGGGLPFPFPGDGGGDGGGGGSPFPIPGGGGGGGSASKDPDFPTSFPATSGADTDYAKQWGMADIGVKDAWTVTKGSPEILVAVIDTGVDYTHEDLAANIWRNPGEMGVDAKGMDRSKNGVDDDGNGYIDDVVGWDFAKNDNRPYDQTSGGFFGGNPGHGTHCAGNIAASAENGRGIIGIAPNVKIMAVRFLSEDGQGDTAGAIQSIKYAVDNGARVLSNSWGSEGDDGDPQSASLREVIQYAQDKGALFIAAAGNGHQGVGYNNDTDPKPGVPASYDNDNIVSVAAIDKNNRFGSFSNWGKVTVDIAAPGVGVYSTVTGNKYMNLDGTSMACPHVAGAAALYWSKHPEANWQDVKSALMSTATPVSALSTKLVSGGKLNVKALISK